MDHKRNGQNDVAKVRPFDEPGFTPVHNAVFDVIMPTLSPNGFKVLMVAIRQTLGWRDPSSDDPRDRKQWDHIAYSQFREKAGIASDATVKRALDECIEHGYLLQKQPLASNATPRTVKGRPYYEYSLNRDYELPDEEPQEATTTETVDLENGPAKSTETVDLKSTETVDLEGVKSTETVDLTSDKPTETVDTKQSLKQQSKGKKQQQQSTAGVVVDSIPQKQKDSYTALRTIGFQPDSDAKRYARDHKAEVVLSWVRWAIRQEGLENPAALVRKRLDAGEPAPNDDIDFGNREERRRYLKWLGDRGDGTLRVNVDHNEPSKRERTFKYADDPDNPGQQIAYEVTLREGENLDDYEIIKGPDGPKLARKVKRSTGKPTTQDKWAVIDEWAAEVSQEDDNG